MYCKVSDSELSFYGHIAWIYSRDIKKALEQSFLGPLPKNKAASKCPRFGTEIKDLAYVFWHRSLWPH